MVVARGATTTAATRTRFSTVDFKLQRPWFRLVHVIYDETMFSEQHRGVPVCGALFSRRMRTGFVDQQNNVFRSYTSGKTKTRSTPHPKVARPQNTLAPPVETGAQARGATDGGPGRQRRQHDDDDNGRGRRRRRWPSGSGGGGGGTAYSQIVHNAPLRSRYDTAHKQVTVIIAAEAAFALKGSILEYRIRQMSFVA